jgi:hypothetical protein
LVSAKGAPAAPRHLEYAVDGADVERALGLEEVAAIGRDAKL